MAVDVTGTVLADQLVHSLVLQRSQFLMTETLQGVDRCPYCSIATPLLSRVWITDHNGTARGDGAKRSKWAAYSCSNCGGVLVARGVTGDQIGSPKIAKVEAVFPSPPQVSEELPPVAREFLRQALATLHAPDAAAVMAGSAVDAMLKHHGYKDGSLYSRIDKAREDGLLTNGMADWAHSVRLGSNRPRHADEDKPHVAPEEARRSVDFAQALGDFLFVLTARIKDATTAAEAA